MRIPADAIIADEKLTRYLLMARPWDDKSGFLGQAGFTLENWRELAAAIRTLCTRVEGTEDGENEYGTFYRVEGLLVGPAKSLDVVLIWMPKQEDKKVHFITLKPRKE